MKDLTLTKKQKEALKCFEHYYLVIDEEDGDFLMQLTDSDKPLTEENFRALYFDGEKVRELEVRDFQYDWNNDVVFYGGYLYEDFIPEEVKELLNNYPSKKEKFNLTEEQKEGLKYFDHHYLIVEDELIRLKKSDKPLTEENFRVLYFEGKKVRELTVRDFQYDRNGDVFFYDGYLDEYFIPEEVKELLNNYQSKEEKLKLTEKQKEPPKCFEHYYLIVGHYLIRLTDSDKPLTEENFRALYFEGEEVRELTVRDFQYEYTADVIFYGGYLDEDFIPEEVKELLKNYPSKEEKLKLTEKQKEALKCFEHYYLIVGHYLIRLTHSDTPLTKENFRAIYIMNDKEIKELTTGDFEYCDSEHNHNYHFYYSYLRRRSAPKEVRELLDTEIQKRNSK